MIIYKRVYGSSLNLKGAIILLIMIIAFTYILHFAIELIQR